MTTVIILMIILFPLIFYVLWISVATVLVGWIVMFAAMGNKRAKDIVKRLDS